jgi:hypothetical protein
LAGCGSRARPSRWQSGRCWDREPHGIDTVRRPGTLGFRVLGSAGPPPVCGGAVAGVAGGLPAAAGPLRAACRPPAWVLLPGLRADLPKVIAPVQGMTAVLQSQSALTAHLPARSACSRWRHAVMATSLERLVVDAADPQALAPLVGARAGVGDDSTGTPPSRSTDGAPTARSSAWPWNLLGDNNLPCSGDKPTTSRSFSWTSPFSGLRVRADGG